MKGGKLGKKPHDGAMIPLSGWWGQRPGAWGGIVLCGGEGQGAKDMGTGGMIIAGYFSLSTHFFPLLLGCPIASK